MHFHVVANSYEANWNLADFVEAWLNCRKINFRTAIRYKKIPEVCTDDEDENHRMVVRTTTSRLLIIDSTDRGRVGSI